MSLVSKGLASKAVAYALGISEAAVSRRLATAAAKLGFVSRGELVRIAAILTMDPRAHMGAADLTPAEQEILRMLELGLSNADVARARARSVRTIANQVASLLRKTGAPSRRALIAKVAGSSPAG